MNKKILGFILFILIVATGVLYKDFYKVNKVTNLTGAVAGGKESLINDENFKSILKNDFKLKINNDNLRNSNLLKDDVLKYDFLFFSDQAFLEKYKSNSGNKAKIRKGKIALNTPLVLYSWEPIVEALIKQDIVQNNNGTYYITDMPKLLKLIEEEKLWKDIGINDIYGRINIISTDPVTSSPGTVYYGLLASIMNGGTVDETNLNDVIPKLKNFYKKSGYLNTSPADLFESYLKTGMGAKPIIVGYESQIIEFINTNPEDWKQMKNKVRVLYPSPTILNSHSIASISENGDKYVDVFSNKKVQDLAWQKHGFRTIMTNNEYKTSKLDINGIPENINKFVSPLKIEMYETIIEYLSKK